MPTMVIYRGPGVTREAYEPYEAELATKPIPTSRPG